MEKAHVFESQHPLVKYKLTRLRNVHTDTKRFRELVREISLLLAYEAMADLALRPCKVTSPLAETTGFELAEPIGLVPILRAGLGMVEALLEMMPTAEVWHIGLYRDEQTLKPVTYYNKLPIEPRVSVVLVLDPMLATGGSAVATVDILKKWGARRIKYMGLIAAPEGIQRLHSVHPDVPIHVAAVDERLTGPDDPWPTGYIMPGLGDAGDRQFGTG